MIAVLLSLLSFLAVAPGETPVVSEAAGTPAPASEARPAASPDSTVAGAGADSSGARRIVREFPVFEVRSVLPDLRSSQTVHEIHGPALRAYPVDGVSDVVALQPGVVAQGEELHVRGGRAGETMMELNGLSLSEPIRHRQMELPLLALRSVELVSGAPESRYAGSLAGVLDLHTVDPGDRLSGEWRWQSDAGLDTRYDRWSGRVITPLPALGLGLVVAGDVMLDDTSLPALRTPKRHDVAGIAVGWRAENRALGYLKLATPGTRRSASLQVLGSRKVHEPFDPMWSIDGWVGDSSGVMVVSPDPRPGFVRYRAADHLAITDERQLATLLNLSAARGAGRATLGLGWLRTRTATTVGGVHQLPSTAGGAAFNMDPDGDPFHVFLGDDPFSRVGGSDVYSLRADVEQARGRAATVRAGAGITYEDVRQDELDLGVLGPVDMLRSYHACAPGGFAYGQGRWQSGGLVLNGGLRAEYYSAGPTADQQTLPGSTGGHVSLSPRVGIAYPISTRDVLSMSYSRVQQNPDRDLLYDRRTVITNRQPLGNPALRPARMISYEAAVKHVISTAWALQSSFFYRDLALLAGARDYQIPGGPTDLRYTDEDQGSAAGFELSLLDAPDERRRIEVHYAFMHAWGYESRAEGDPYGPVRDARTAPTGEQPLSWDRRHTFIVSGAWAWRNRLTLGWSSLVGSGLPWTPKPRRQVLTDVLVVNSRRFAWTETTNLTARWEPPRALGLVFGLEARNLFDSRGERAATVDGYPNAFINTVFDDYGAYRTETGLGGGAYWTTVGGFGHWVPVHDPRLLDPPRAIRASVGRSW